MYYLIKEKLVECGREDILNDGAQFVAVVKPEEWKTDREFFDMGIDIEPDISGSYSTKAEVNYDSLTGSFCIPEREDPSLETSFSFALDEKGIVFIDGGNKAESIIEGIIKTKKWRLPSLERFIYDFLEQIVNGDREFINKYDSELDIIENDIIAGKEGVRFENLFEIKNDIRDLRVHYEQLLDFSQELEENENNFFKHDNLRYFRLFSSRIERLRDTATAVGDRASQIRDIYMSHLDVKQNHIMTVLTIVTTIFLPLTLIAGWYGMNFKYMPELGTRWGYPVVIAVSALIVIVSLIVLKKKKWL